MRPPVLATMPHPGTGVLVTLIGPTVLKRTDDTYGSATRIDVKNPILARSFTADVVPPTSKP